MVNVLADPYDVGYGAVSRARNLTLLFNRAKLKITTSPHDMYKAITDHLNKNQTSIQSMFLETDTDAFQHEITSILKKSRLRDKSAATFEDLLAWFIAYWFSV